MRKLLIADDEANIREGLKVIIDWDELGYSFDCEASDGPGALELIQSNDPDLVLMDIHMPFINGIDVIRQARDNGYKGKFIILSGYSDFAFAKAAIRYGVTDYLTKPIDEDELMDVVNRINKDLEKESSINGQNDIMQYKAKDTVINELITGICHDDMPKAALDKEGLKKLGLYADAYQVALYETYQGYEDQGNVSPEYSLKDLLNIFIPSDEYAHTTIDGRDAILLLGKKAIGQFERFLEHYNYRPLQKGSPLYSIFLTYGEIVDSPDKVCESYNSALELCRRRFFCSEDAHTFGFNQLPGKDVRLKHIDALSGKEYCIKLCGYIQIASIDKFRQSLMELDSDVRICDMNEDEIRLFLTDIVLQIKEQINRTYPECMEYFDGNSQLIEQIKTRFYLYEIVKYIDSMCTKAIQNIRSKSGAESAIEDVVSYIDHNYAQSLTLEEVAPLFGYNSVYFGKLFSKEMNISFNSYLNEKRMIEAKKLLRDSELKVYEIAARVGYNDVDYFSKKFKNSEGKSPADYRRNSRIGGQK